MHDFLTIIRRYLKGTISTEEKEALKRWVASDPENERQFKQEVKNWYKQEKNDLDIDPNSAFERFVNRIDQKENKVITLKPIIKRIIYAAVVTGVIFGAYTFLNRNLPVTKKTPAVVEIDEAPLDKIRIVQADGTTSYIGTNDSDKIIDAHGHPILQKDQDTLVIQGQNLNTKTEFLEISIPKGKLFQLALSDGTKVWLNAASSLKFPRVFNAGDQYREVHLVGEAFFDVTTNNEQPFIVNTGKVNVEVLGTQFNVSSYNEDSTVKTTLVEGSVAVKDPANKNNQLKLTPNHQAIYNKDNKILAQKEVNPDIYTSWMRKKIIVHNEPFKEVYKRIERTYDVEITSLNEKLNNTHFTGEFDIESVQQILNVFSKTIEFTYEIEDKKITINP
ncbi:FecR family protein [Aquimarina sp. U1-2]|uniref:FecR family protein n=1 Tax=Aquimarina sp. U1-2 TaxID=2823141 RepID=UPI001AED01E4|nr:FecR domain-containing protein [Aquimarina sp. U1-2]MBP2833305.1 FecR family protein [Aquimarina sp. U1-2]